MPQKIIEPIDKINNFLKYFFKFPSDHIILKKRRGSDYYNIVESAKIKYEFSNEDKRISRKKIRRNGIKK